MHSSLDAPRGPLFAASRRPSSAATAAGPNHTIGIHSHQASDRGFLGACATLAETLWDEHWCSTRRTSLSRS